MKVVLFSATFYPGHEQKILFFADKLSKICDLTLVLKSNQMYLNRIKKADNNVSCGFPGYPRKIFFKNSTKEIKKYVFLNNWNYLYKIFKKNDIVILTSYRDNQKLISYCRLRNIPVIVLQYPASWDGFGEISPSLYLALNKDDKNFYNWKYNNKKFYKVSHNDEVKSTGSVQYYYKIKKNEKKNFFTKYNLDPKKKTFIFCPSAPSSHNDYYKTLYKKICSEISENYNLIIKLHPTETFGRKSIYPKNTNSRNELFSNAQQFDDKDFYDLISLSHAVVSIDSTFFHEIEKFKKPIIYVNRFHIYAYKALNFKKVVSLPQNLYSAKIAKKKFNFGKKFLFFLRNHYSLTTKNNNFLKIMSTLNSNCLHYYGCTIELKDLKKTLKKIITHKKFNKKKYNDEFKNIIEAIKIFMDKKNNLKVLEIIKLILILIYKKFLSITKILKFQ